MRRALALIISLTMLSFGLGIWVDMSQRHTARGYLDALEAVRAAVLAGRMEQAAGEQAYVHARWQHDARWLNFLIGHHHTRSVTTAMTELSTALEQGWRSEALRALDRVNDALGDIENSDFATLENIL